MTQGLTPQQHADNRELAKARKRRNKGGKGYGEGREARFTFEDARKEFTRRRERAELEEFNEVREEVIRTCAEVLFKHQRNRPLAGDMSPEDIFRFVEIYAPNVSRRGVQPVEGVKRDVLDALHVLRRRAAVSV
jgi:hypothetical protein